MLHLGLQNQSKSILKPIKISIAFLMGFLWEFHSILAPFWEAFRSPLGLIFASHAGESPTFDENRAPASAGAPFTSLSQAWLLPLSPPDFLFPMQARAPLLRKIALPCRREHFLLLMQARAPLLRKIVLPRRRERHSPHCLKLGCYLCLILTSMAFWMDFLLVFLPKMKLFLMADWFRLRLFIHS